MASTKNRYTQIIEAIFEKYYIDGVHSMSSLFRPRAAATNWE